tara:strand:- start:148 stop:789 length:642 start_codon:yes stop_codon:yes gene_type:complete
MPNDSLTSYLVNPSEPDHLIIEAAVRALKQGELIAYPTDTLYALGVDPSNREALGRLFETKRRPPAREVPLVAANIAQVEECLGELPRIGRFLAEKFWPGPLTLVIEMYSESFRTALVGQDTVAVRVPNSLIACELATELGSPITATSANRTGERPAHTALEALAAIGHDLSVLLDGGVADLAVPSTIIDVRADHPILIRAGSVSWDSVLESI